MLYFINEALIALCQPLIEFGIRKDLGLFVWPCYIVDKPMILLNYCPSSLNVTSLLERSKINDKLVSATWACVEALISPLKLGVDFGIWDVYPYKIECKQTIL